MLQVTTKVLLILLFTYVCYYCGTSPTLRPTAKEREPYQRNRLTGGAIKFAETVLQYAGKCIKTALWLESGLQLFCILFCQLDGLITNDVIHPERAVSQVCDATKPILQPQYVIAVALGVIAALIRHQCYQHLGEMFTFELAIISNHHLVQSGPYNVVRHPGYGAFLLLNVGIMMTHYGPESSIRPPLALLLPPLAISVYNAFIFWSSIFVSLQFCKRAMVEDQVLCIVFGKKWEDWANTVPYRLIPGIW